MQPPSGDKPAQRWPKAEAWLAAGLVLGALAALGYHCAWLRVPLVDDAAISLAYGQSLFAGEGLRATRWSQPVEAFSNPLWTLLLGLSGPLHLPPLGYAQWLGVALGMGALGALALWGPVSGGRRLRLEDAVVPWVAALNPTYAYWVASGMETGLQALLLSLSGVLWLREVRQPGGSAHVGWALGLLCLTRPEGVLFAGAAGVLWLVHRGLQRQRPGRQELLILAWGVVLVGGWLVVRWAYFADWLPNTYYAKRYWDFGARGYLQGFLDTYRGLCVLGAVGLALGLFGGPAQWRQAALGAAFTGCGVYFVLSARGDWMREWRFLAPLVPLLGAAAGLGLGVVREAVGWARERGWPGPVSGALGVPAVAGLGLLGLALQGAVGRAAAVRAGPELPYEYIANQFRALQPRLQALGQVRPLLAFPDLGGQALVMREAEILDAAGLADRALAYHAGNLPALEDYLVSEGPPVLMDAHGPSGHLGALGKLVAHMEPAGGPLWKLKGLTAQEDPRCPGGKAAVLALEAQALAGRLEAHIAADRGQEALRLWRCAFAYAAWERLPAEEERERLANLAEARAEALEREGRLELALRQRSLATLLDGGDAHRRRRTELLRARLFPAPAPR